jgi:hypothetical protein
LTSLPLALALARWLIESENDEARMPNDQGITKPKYATGMGASTFQPFNPLTIQHGEGNRLG